MRCTLLIWLPVAAKCLKSNQTNNLGCMNSKSRHTQWFCCLCVLNTWCIRIPNSWHTSHRTQRLINQSEDVFVEHPVCVISVAVIMTVVFELGPLVLDWDSWCFTRWVPGNTITIGNKTTGCNVLRNSNVKLPTTITLAWIYLTPTHACEIIYPT